jgi:Helix-turn-helix domain
MGCADKSSENNMQDQLPLNRAMRRAAKARGVGPETQDAFDRVRVRILPDGRMDTENAAAYLGHAPKTLDQWAYQGKGPKFVKAGGKRFYFRADLDAFIRGRVA